MAKKRTVKPTFDVLTMVFILQLIVLVVLGANAYFVRRNTETAHDLLVLFKHEQDQWDHFMSMMNNMPSDPSTADHNWSQPGQGTLDDPHVERKW